MAEALALTRAHGFVNQTVIWLGNLGELALRRGERERARSLLSESLALERELRQPRTIAESLDQLAQLASLEGQPERATRLVGAAAAIREEHGLPRERAALPDHEHLQSALRAALSEATFAAAWAEGQAMSLEQAIDYALAPAATPVAAAPLAPVSDLLSKRELEVLRLVAEGKSNQEIAAALFISPHTVGNHVASIFNKLGLDSRTAAAAYALRHGLV
jgi:DNA-binding CsgD family transcriptional regulator